MIVAETTVPLYLEVCDAARSDERVDEATRRIVCQSFYDLWKALAGPSLSDEDLGRVYAARWTQLHPRPSDTVQSIAWLLVPTATDEDLALFCIAALVLGVWPVP